ncbi:MAG: hypothetical protein IPO21_09720 [Bacteroidales bacterium]|nr:hypothetical protein [Bacteroidales bacterium]
MAHSEGEIVKDNDIVRGILVEVDSTGNVVPDGIVRESASIYINSIKDEEIKARFISLKLDDTIIYNPLKATGNEADVASLIGTEKENSEKINADYVFTIESISHFEQAEINQEFFDKAFGEGTISSEAEMKEKVKAEIEGRFESNSELKFMNDCREKLIDASAIELPETFLKKWLKITNKDNDKLTDEVFETEFPLFIKDLRWQVIKGKLVTDLEIKLTQEDILGAAKDQARQQFYQFGMFSPDEEMVNRWADEILKNKEELNKIIEIESDRKISRTLKEKAAVNTKEVTVEEFSSLIEK